MEKDRGVAFAQHLQGMPGWKRFSVSRSSSDVWYLEFGSVKTLEDFAEIDCIDGTIANPGRFEGEVDSLVPPMVGDKRIRKRRRIKKIRFRLRAESGFIETVLEYVSILTGSTLRSNGPAAVRGTASVLRTPSDISRYPPAKMRASRRPPTGRASRRRPIT